ncbi:MAG: hypothetical protein Q7T50_04640 [Candidatus Magasanikbacteria bacterium]|nr:hypothetical protein [Candidatus Magasanikbacteria bacterium]
MKICLCISFLLLNSSSGENQKISNIYKSSQDACIKNKMLYPESSPFYKECRSGVESGPDSRPVISALLWLLANGNQLKLEGVSDLVLDTFHETKFQDAQEVIRLLKKIQVLGIKLLRFDKKDNVIDLGSMDELISSDDYLEIMISSLIRQDGIQDADQENYGDPEPEVNGDIPEESDQGAVLRIPVWLELQSNGSFSIVAKNKRRNKNIIDRLAVC